MVRVRNPVASRKRRKRLFKRAKGFTGDRKNHACLTQDAVMKALAFNYRDRKKKKGAFRRLWIIRIGIATKAHGISYSKFVHGLALSGCTVNRKMLSNLAIEDPKGFTVIVERAKRALA
ncbi:MAG: 50S ribosomal protein L20 [Simkaniaceae bacterium]|nr:50S ribosomal protein L20 [Simkaniaceae bacterium]